jgi:hypothetical protein
MRTNIPTHSAFIYSRFLERNDPDVPLEGKTCRGTLLNQYDLNVCGDGISVNVGV